MVERTTLVSEKIKIESKTFFFDLKENSRGQFLKITEDVRGRRDTIMVPVAGLVEFKEAIETMLEHADVEEYEEDDYEAEIA